MFQVTVNRWSGLSRAVFIAFLLCFIAQNNQLLAQQAEDDHAASDAYWAQKAQSYPAFEVDVANLRTAAANELNALGEWGPVLDWPHIPVSAAHLPDGRILTWASNQEEGFPAGPEFTYAAAWDPLDGSFKMVPHNSHDMFCAHQVMLEDGRLLVMGGRNTVPLTSIFDPETDTWVPQESMANGRWYPTSVAMPNGDVMIAVGSGGGSYPEVWNDNSGWRTLSNVNLSAPILNYTGYYENNWWPLLHVAPNGDVFHSGPTPDMHYINTGGTGSITKTGPQILNWYPKHGATVMYEEGKLLVAGGAISGGNQASSNRAMTIDISGDTPVMTEIASMAFARKFQNGVMLPTGEVLIIGGNTSGTKFSDAGTVLAAEMWNPETGQWTTLSDMSVPRNYHSVALLMTDGRVWSGGGGLCGAGCAANHVDAQVFTPPYLYNADGSLAARPSITSAPETVRNGATMSVGATAGLAKFSLIKMSSTTHGVNSDVRYLSVPFTENGAGSYTLTAHENVNVLTPGYWMLFGVDANGVPSEAAIIQVSTEGVPQVTNPGTQVTPEGDVVSLFIAATDDDALSFSATGLPGGLFMNGSTGEISGTVGEGTAGSYDVEVTVSDALGNVSINFNWVVTTGATGTILREWWTGISGSEINLLTGDPDYPENPDGSDYLTSFEAPADWADNYGTRIRGYIHPPVTGDYTFWISTDDYGELWLSTDGNPANAAKIANVPGWANDHDWYKFPEQQSAQISLTAGERYYVEVLQKEGGGLDNIAVAWQIPGGSLEIIDGGFLSPYSGAPMIDPMADVTTVEGASISLASISATDPEGDALAYSASSLPDGLSINASTGVITGTIDDGTAGSHTVSISVSDGVNDTVTTFDWNVLENDAAHAGVAFEYVEGDWDVLPDFDALNAAGLGVVDNFDISPRSQNDYFGFRFSGFIQIETAGDYTFYTTSDDGSKLYIDGATIVDNDGLHAAAEKSGTVNLGVGYHPIQVTFFEKGGAESLIVQYVGPGISKQTIPDGKLFVNVLSNQPPEITAVSDQSGAEGEAVSLSITASDADGDALTYSATGLPAGVSVDASSGLISGGIVAGGAASSMVTVTVSDGDASASTTFTWTIDPARGSWIDFTDDSSIRLTITSISDTDTEEKDVAVGDFNKDGWDDIVVVRKEGFMATGARQDLLLMNENGTLVDRTETLAPGFAAEPTIARDAVIADFDGDGWDDLVIANTFGDQPMFYRNKGQDAGGWLGLENESAARLPTLDVGSIQYCGVTYGDVNGDGALDLYFANYIMDGTTQDVLLINDGAGNFTDEGDGRLGELINVAFGVQASIIDIDKDGDQDIVKLSAEHAAQPWGEDGIFILYNDGTGNFTDWSTVPSNFAYMFAIEDFDADGNYDFYIVDDEADYVNRSTGVTANSNISFSQTATPWARTAGHGANLHMGDLDRDGDIDIGVADVDTSFPPCEAEEGSLRAFLLLENEDNASGTFIDPFGAADKPWNVNMFDFAFVDVDNDGNLDIFAAGCNGYSVFTSTQDPVDPPTETVTIALGDLKRGISGQDGATGTGYIMYSEEDLHDRFAAFPPSVWAADHLIAVKYDGSQWVYDTNRDYYAFSPAASDRLLAEVDFSADTVTLLQGVNSNVEGIASGYVTGDLVITPNVWNGSPDTGEFYPEGTYVEVSVVDANGNAAPVLASIGDQLNFVGEPVSLSLSATDSNGDALSYSATGLPAGLSVSGAEIIGTPTTAGTFSATVTVADGNGGADAETFAWTIDGGDPTETIMLDLGDLNNGIAAHDPRTGTGYIMYSEESVHTRFADNPPSAWNADHLIAVVFEAGEWKVDRNKYHLVPFAPLGSDHLLAEVDFGANTVTHLQGMNTVVEGINAGFVSGDLVITPEMWDGASNAGEFGVTGTFVEIPGEAAQAIARGPNPQIFNNNEESLPEAFSLASIYPNPFASNTTIEYAIPEESAVRIEIYTITGQRVRTLIDNGRMPAGHWQSVWDGSDDSGRRLAAGVYMIRFDAGGHTQVRKAVLIR